MERGQADMDAVIDVVRGIVDSVRKDGDQALSDITARIDGISLPIDAIEVTKAEFDQAERQVAPTLREALERAHANIVSYHSEQLPEPMWKKEIVPGVVAGERVTPIDPVGIYVPRGKGSFPSVMLMLCVPAIIAKVPRIAVCTPPGPDGSADAACLVAAQLCGVGTVYKAGGAQAIAALAYGTETIPRVAKIVGPGNQYVSAAKRLVQGATDPGLPAGPSEAIVLADGSADPQITAREWLVEAEHGPDSAALLVTHCVEVADSVEAIATALVADLPEPRRTFVEAVLGGHGGIVLTQDLDASIEFVNDYAPEHLRVIALEPYEVLSKITDAGEVLLGNYSSIPYGNFAIGLNAVLPTGGKARSYSGVGVHTFLKRSSFAYVSAEGAREIGPIAVGLAQWEGFPAHEEAARYTLNRAGQD